MILDMDIPGIVRYLGGAVLRSFLSIVPLVLIAYFTFWVLLKKRLYRRRIQHKPRNFRKRIRYEVIHTAIILLVFALSDLLLYIFSGRGIVKAYLRFDEYPLWYWACSVAFLFLFHDTWFYWTHRLLHHPFFFRHIHHVHHYSNDPTPFSSFSMHPLEAVLLNGWVFITALLIPVHFLTFVTFQLVSTILNIIGHLGYEVYPRGFLNTWLRWKTTSTHHNLHHSTSKSNFGLYFTWWDKWMGTESKNYKDLFRQVTEPGIDENQALNSN
jgi:lathosterol oxidase